MRQRGVPFWFGRRGKPVLNQLSEMVNWFTIFCVIWAGLGFSQIVLGFQIICPPLVPGMGAAWGFIVNALTPGGELDVVFWLYDMLVSSFMFPHYFVFLIPILVCCILDIFCCAHLANIFILLSLLLNSDRGHSEISVRVEEIFLLSKVVRYVK